MVTAARIRQSPRPDCCDTDEGWPGLPSKGQVQPKVASVRVRGYDFLLRAQCLAKFFFGVVQQLAVL